jgi:hypothetical protein
MISMPSCSLLRVTPQMRRRLLLASRQTLPLLHHLHVPLKHPQPWVAKALLSQSVEVESHGEMMRKTESCTFLFLFSLQKFKLW